MNRRDDGYFNDGDLANYLHNAYVSVVFRGTRFSLNPIFTARNILRDHLGPGILPTLCAFTRLWVSKQTGNGVCAI